MDIDKKIEAHLSLNEEYLKKSIDINNDKEGEEPEINEKKIEDLVPTNILSEPRYIAFGGGVIANAKTTVTETMVKSIKNTSDKVDVVSQVSDDKKEGTIKDGAKETLKNAHDVTGEGVKSLAEAQENIEGGNGVTISSNTEVQVSSANTLSMSSGRVGNIQAPLLVSQSSSNIDYSETKTIINNLQSTRSEYLFSESQRDVNITNKGLNVSQSSEERTLRKSLNAVQSYDETSALIARNSQVDTTITDNQSSFVTNTHIQQAQKGGIHFMVGSTGNGGNSPALLRPVLPGEFNPQEQIYWSMTGGSIKATSTSEFNIKTKKSNTSANNIGLLAKETLSSIASNNGIYGDITTMIGKKALSTGTSLLSMTTMIGKFTFMSGFLSVAHQVLSGDISRIASIILPRIKIPTNLPIPPLPSKSSSYTEADLRKCLPDKPSLPSLPDGTSPTTPPISSNDDSINNQDNNNINNDDSINNQDNNNSNNDNTTSEDSFTFTKVEELEKIERELNKPKSVNNKTISSPFSGPPSSISWKGVLTKEGNVIETSTSTSKQVQTGVDLLHKVSFAPNTYLEAYGVSNVSTPKPTIKPIPIDVIKKGKDSITPEYLNKKIDISNLTDIDKKTLKSRVDEILIGIKEDKLPNDLNESQISLIKEIIDELAIDIGMGSLSIPGIINPKNYMDGISRYLNNISKIGDIPTLSNINDIIGDLKEDTIDKLIPSISSIKNITKGDLLKIKGNVDKFVLNILEDVLREAIKIEDVMDMKPYVPLVPTDGNVVNSFNTRLSKLLVTYIMEPDSSIKEIEELLKEELEVYYKNAIELKDIVIKNISPIINKVKSGDILDLIDTDNLRGLVKVVGGDNTVNKIDGIIDNVESLIGTYRAIEAIPKLLKLLSENNIPTLSKVNTILSCLSLADRVTDVIGIIKSPLSYKPKVDIPKAITFFDEKEKDLYEDIYTSSDGSISSLYPNSSISSNFYMDTFKVLLSDDCEVSEVNIPKNEIVINSKTSFISGNITYPYRRSNVLLIDFIEDVIGDMKEGYTYEVHIDEDVSFLSFFINNYKDNPLYTLKVYYV